MTMIRRRRGHVPTASACSARAAAGAAWMFGVAVTGGLLAESSTVARADGDDRTAEPAHLPTSDSAAASISADAVDHMKEAQERAIRFRAAGDEGHARVADGLAREWTETARDLELAATAEQMAADRRREAMRDQAQLQRTRTLVEEDIARLGRMRAELDAVASAIQGRLRVDVRAGEVKGTMPAGPGSGHPSAASPGGKP